MQPVATARVRPVGPPFAHFDLSAGTSTTAEPGALASPRLPSAPVLIVGPKPSSPESNRPLPSASGKPMPLPRRHGALQAVVGWEGTRAGAALFSKGSPPP